MARQNYNVNTGEKKIEVYTSFGGGMVTQSHPEKLRDDESVLIENADIVAAGVLIPRGGYQKTNTSSTVISGNTQGRFRYENLAGGQDIVAINGKLYSVSGSTYTQIVIPGLAAFQASRPIEAVQDRTNMYFATGSGVVKYDGVSAALITAYAPTALEALYVGTNGYSTSPDTYMTDVAGNANALLGVVPGKRYGIVNEKINFTAYVTYISGNVLEYKWEYKNISEVDYKVAKDWSTTKELSLTFSQKGDYILRITLRVQGTTTELSQYILPRYKVNSVPDEKPEQSVTFENMKTCNRIFIHHDRLYLYGDTTFPDNLYCSQRDNFTYFPRTFITKVTDSFRGSLQTVVRYRGFLIAWTNNSIYTIRGREPKEFEKEPIHTTLGTKHPYSVQIMKNYIAFVGNDNGIYYLKSFNYASDDKLNIERIDDKIRDVVVDHIKAATFIQAAIYNDQYYLYIEGSTYKYMYRFYYDYGLWVRDTFVVNLRNVVAMDNFLYATSKLNGDLYKLNPDVFRDETSTVYTMKVHSKNFNFGHPHHRKKMKVYQLLAKLTNSTTITVKLYADDVLLSTTQLQHDPLQAGSDAQKLKIMQSGRFRYVQSEIEIPVNESVELIGFGFIFKENTPK